MGQKFPNLYIGGFEFIFRGNEELDSCFRRCINDGTSEVNIRACQAIDDYMSVIEIR